LRRPDAWCRRPSDRSPRPQQDRTSARRETGPGRRTCGECGRFRPVRTAQQDNRDRPTWTSSVCDIEAHLPELGLEAYGLAEGLEQARIARLGQRQCREAVDLGKARPRDRLVALAGI